MPPQLSSTYADLEHTTKEAKCFLQSAVSAKDKDGNVVGCTSFWSDEVKPHAPFGVELLTLDAQGGNPVSFGAKAVKFKVPRGADALWKASVAQKFVGICSLITNADGSRTLATGDAAPYWINAVGIAASPVIRVTTGEGQELCNARTDIMDYIKDSTNVESDRQLRVASHRFENADGSDDVKSLQAYSRHSSIKTHTMAFAWGDWTGKALLVGCMFLAGVGFEVDFAPKEGLYVVPGQACGAPVYVRPDGVSDAELQERLDAGTWRPVQLQDTDLKASIDAACIAMEEEERADLCSRPVDQLWEEVQVIRKLIPSPVNGTAGEAYEVDIKFTHQHLISRYTLVARRAISLKGNTPFDFGGIRDVDTGIQAPIIKAIGVDFGATMRIPMRDSVYLTEIAPKFHGAARIPRGKHINQVCFQLDMQDPDHTGGADALVVEDITLHTLVDPAVFTPESPTVEALLMLHYYRFVRSREGGMISRFVRL